MNRSIAGRLIMTAAGIGILAGCGTAVPQSSAPPGEASCVSIARQADPSLTPAQAAAQCTADGPPESAATVPAPQPASPPQVDATCTIGYLDVDTNVFYPLDGPAVPDTDISSPLMPQVEATLPASASSSVNVGTFDVIFYDSSGQETGSGTDSLSQILVPGASLAAVDDDSEDLPSGTTSCTAPDYSSS